MVKLNNNFLVSEFGDDTHIFIHASEIDNMYYWLEQQQKIDLFAFVA